MVNGAPQTKNAVLLSIALVASVAAIIGNVIIYIVAQSIGDVTLLVPTPDGAQLELSLLMLLMMSIIPAIGAASLYFGLSRIVVKPLRFFQSIAAVVLLLSFIPLFTLDIETDVRGYLLAMHVLTAGIIVGIVTVMVRRSAAEHA